MRSRSTLVSWSISTLALLVALLSLAPRVARAEDRDGSAPALAVTGTALVLAGAVLGAGYGVYLLVEPSSCAQTGADGSCLRMRTPAAERRDVGLGLLVGSGVALAAGVALAVGCEQLLRSSSEAGASASVIAPWVYADPSGVILGALGSF